MLHDTVSPLFIIQRNILTINRNIIPLFYIIETLFLRNIKAYNPECWYTFNVSNVLHICLIDPLNVRTILYTLLQSIHLVAFSCIMKRYHISKNNIKVKTQKSSELVFSILVFVWVKMYWRKSFYIQHRTISWNWDTMNKTMSEQITHSLIFFFGSDW